MTPLAAAAFFYRGVPRWTFGMDNPNKAAAILAILLLLLLAAALRTRRDWLCWTCSALAAAAGYGLVHTFSRGGMAAFVAGTLILAVGFRKELRRRQRWIPALLVMLVLAGSAAWTGFAGRMSGSSPAADASVGNRLTVWRNVPSMMTDAPGGWGRGAAGDAFMGWYQPLDRRERYRTLVNSHFTWLVEHGWVVRLCYVWGLVFFLWAGALRLKARGDPLPLAVWACFVVAAFFSSVAEDWLVCAIPLAMLVPMLRTFWTSSAKRATLAGSLLVSGVLLSCAVVLGVACRPPGVIPVCRSLDGGRMVVGEGASAGWIVCDTATLGGAAFGRTLRAFAASPEGRGRAYCLAGDLADVPADAQRLAICGQAADAGPDALSRFASLSDVRVLSPNRPDKWLAARSERPFIHVFCGEFAPSCPAEDAEGLTVVPGAANYLPDWPRLAFGPRCGCGPEAKTIK